MEKPRHPSTASFALWQLDVSPRKKARLAGGVDYLEISAPRGAHWFSFILFFTASRRRYLGARP